MEYIKLPEIENILGIRGFIRTVVCFLLIVSFHKQGTLANGEIV